MNMGMGGIGVVLMGLLGMATGAVNPIATGLVLIVGMFGFRSGGSAEAVAMPAFSIEQFAEAMADPMREEEALGQVAYPIMSGGFEGETRDRLIEILAAHLVGPREWDSWATPASLLLELEGAEALPRFERDEVMAIDNPRLAEALTSLNENGLAISASRHDAMLAKLLALDALNDRQQQALEAAVVLLSQRGESARPRLEELRGDARARIGALRGLVTLAGIDDPWVAAWSGRRRTPNQTTFLALESYRQAMEWGGHHDFFASEEAGDFPAIIRALKTEGHLEAARIARAAAILPAGTSWQKGTMARQELLQRMDEASQEKLAALDQEMQAYQDDLAACAFEIVLRYPREFGGEQR